MKGYKHRAATCAIMREKALKRCEDPAVREQLKRNGEKIWADPIKREAHIAAMKAGWDKRRGHKLNEPSPEVIARAQRNGEKAKAYLAANGFS